MIELLIAGFILGGAGAAAIIFFAPHLGLVDIPNDRSSHSTPTPKGGGIGILAAFLLACTATGQPLLFSFAAASIALLGLQSDRREFSPQLRLFLQFFCAGLAVLPLYSNLVPGMMTVVLLPLFLLFIVGTANFYNFMDGINGIAAITGAVAFGFLAFYPTPGTSETVFRAIPAAISFSCLGFLPFNFPRARVFMGDIGSVLLGFLFAFLVLALSSTVLEFLCYASLLFPFYIDELSTMIIRLKNGENLTEAHRKHLYQILANEASLPHWKVSLLYGLLQVVVGICIFALKPFGIIAVLFFLFLISVSFIVVSLSLRQRCK
ncbi:MAG: glycosyltransferase family 4 protein [Desulfopila sp.]|jgi:Fuc2NAc and GlcNAc transferase|nr:glycosyltransferase family 4 protein [Desulfopila sp.]